VNTGNYEWFYNSEFHLGIPTSVHSQKKLLTKFMSVLLQVKVLL